MSNDLSLTQPARVTRATVRQAEARVAEVMDAVRASGSADAAAKFLGQSDAVEQLTALMRAELLYSLSTEWRKIGMSAEFYEWVFKKTGKDKTYAERRVRVGAMLADTDLPTLYRDKLKLRSMEELIMLAAAWDGGELRPTKPQWEKLLALPDPTAIGDEIRRLLGRKERSNGMTLFYTAATGEVEAWRDGLVASGVLKLGGDPDVAAAATSRIVKAARMQPK